MKRILITRTDRLGDVVLSTPAIRLVRRQYPDAYIAFMVKPENREIVAGNPHLDEVITYDKRRTHKGLLRTIIFALKLRKKKFDTAIALHPTNRVHIMLFAAGIPARIGYDRKMSRLLTRRMPHRKQEGLKHEVDYNFDLLAFAGITVKDADRRPYITVLPEYKKRAEHIMETSGITDNIVAIHAGASCPSKRWPPGRFSRVADALAAKRGACIVLVGGKESGTFNHLVISEMRRPAIDLTGKLTIGELAAFFTRCRLLISNDSGPVHVAVAVGTPVISIFGRRDTGLSPLRWGPLGKKDVVFHKNVGCTECLAHNCLKGFACLKAVTVDEISRSAERFF